MESLKEVFAILGAVIGAISGALTLYAKYLDVKKKRADEAKSSPSSPPPPPAPPSRAVTRALPPPPRQPTRLPYDEYEPCDEPAAPPQRAEPAAVARAREAVRGPAIALISAGVLSLAFNLLIGTFGFFTEFVAPPESRAKDKEKSDAPDKEKAAKDAKDAKISDRTAAAMAVAMLLGLSVASAAAIWAGYNMLHLRSYWLSVAGSVAIMPGACYCCLTGVPVGAWCLVVLLKPEISSAFR